jgi:hypothetical protein
MDAESSSLLSLAFQNVIVSSVTEQLLWKYLPNGATTWLLSQHKLHTNLLIYKASLFSVALVRDSSDSDRTFDTRVHLNIN